MNQNFLPLASELMSGSEPVRNIIACSLNDNILLLKYCRLLKELLCFWCGRNVCQWVILYKLGGCEILKTRKQNLKRKELFPHCFYACLAKVIYKILTSYILDL